MIIMFVDHTKLTLCNAFNTSNSVDIFVRFKNLLANTYPIANSFDFLKIKSKHSLLYFFSLCRLFTKKTKFRCFLSLLSIKFAFTISRRRLFASRFFRRPFSRLRSSQSLSLIKRFNLLRPLFRGSHVQTIFQKILFYYHIILYVKTF